MVEVPLTRGFVTRVDDEDFEKFCKDKKYFYKVGGDKGGGYAARSEVCYKNSKKTYRTIRLHREIMDCPDDMEVDHNDSDRLNNQKYNLSIVPKIVNIKKRWKKC
jgi:hypothetical protein